MWLRGRALALYKGGRKGKRKGRREGAREGASEGAREGTREWGRILFFMIIPNCCKNTIIFSPNF